MGPEQGKGYNLETLHENIAQYYGQICESESDKWTSLEVLMPHMFQFEHFIHAKEYAAAYNVLQQIHERLMQWGHFERVAEMAKMLLKAKDFEELDRQVQGNIEGYYGQAYLGLGGEKLGEAQQSLEAARVSAQEAKNLKDEVRWTGYLALAELGLAYRGLPTHPPEAMTQFMEALQKLEGALGMAHGAGDRQYEVTWAIMLGTTKQFLAEQLGHEPDRYIAEAIDHYKQAEIIAEEIKDRVSQMQAKGSLARYNHDQGNYDVAIQYGRDALALARDLGDRWAQATIHGNLGSTQLKLGKIDAAIAHYEQAEALSQETGDMLGKAIQRARLLKAYNSLGLRELEQKQFEGAKAYFEKAMEYFEQAQSRFTTIDRKREASLRIRQATAQVGSTVCEPGWAEEDDWAGSLAPALAEYREALETYLDQDEVHDAIGNLEKMREAGVPGLEPAFDLLGAIDSAGLSEPIGDILKEAGISTLHQLRGMTDEKLEAIKGIGPARRDELKDRLDKL